MYFKNTIFKEINEIDYHFVFVHLRQKGWDRKLVLYLWVAWTFVIFFFRQRREIMLPSKGLLLILIFVTVRYSVSGSVMLQELITIYKVYFFLQVKRNWGVSSIWNCIRTEGFLAILPDRKSFKLSEFLKTSPSFPSVPKVPMGLSIPGV